MFVEVFGYNDKRGQRWGVVENRGRYDIDKGKAVVGRGGGGFTFGAHHL